MHKFSLQKNEQSDKLFTTTDARMSNDQQANQKSNCKPNASAKNDPVQAM